jgi:hypothetical protein
MNNYYLKIIILQNCSYSIAANKLIQLHKIPVDITTITRDNIDKYVTNKIDTFPQIYLARKNHNGVLLLGGHSDLKSFIDTFKNQINNDDVERFIKKYNWSKKATLRLIQLINI